MTICAVIQQVCPCYLLVCDCCTGQHIQVNTDQASCFQCGEQVCIHHCGMMTNSLPPQISATCIQRMGC